MVTRPDARGGEVTDGATSGTASRNQYLRHGPLRLELARRELTVEGWASALQLTTLQARFVATLLRHAPGAVPYAVLVEAMWPEESGEEKNIRYRVSELRGRLASHVGVARDDPDFDAFVFWQNYPSSTDGAYGLRRNWVPPSIKAPPPHLARPTPTPAEPVLQARNVSDRPTASITSRDAGLDLRGDLVHPEPNRRALTSEPPRSELVEELNEVEVHIDLERQSYHLTYTKVLRNVSPRPINRVMFWVGANRFPDDSLRNHDFYQADPLRWDWLQVSARDQTGMLDVQLLDHFSSRMNFYIHFRHSGVPYPLRAGQARQITYSYTVPMTHWGPHIDRSSTYSTSHYRVRVLVPASMNCFVGGVEISQLREPRDLEDPIVRRQSGADTVEWVWECLQPSAESTFRIQWTDPLPPRDSEFEGRKA